MLTRKRRSGAAYPRVLLAAQLVGVLLYLAFAVFNISRISWALGALSTVFQTLVFCVLPLGLFCWLAVRICWAVLRFVGRSWAALLAALPDTSEWEETYFEDLKRCSENEHHKYL